MSTISSDAKSLQTLKIAIVEHLTATSSHPCTVPENVVSTGAPQPQPSTDNVPLSAAQHLLPVQRFQHRWNRLWNAVPTNGQENFQLCNEWRALVSEFKDAAIAAVRAHFTELFQGGCLPPHQVTMDPVTGLLQREGPVIREGLRLTLVDSSASAHFGSANAARKGAACEVRALNRLHAIEHLREVMFIPLTAVVSLYGYDYLVDTNVGLSRGTLQAGVYRSCVQTLESDPCSGEAPIPSSKTADFIFRGLASYYGLRPHVMVGTNVVTALETQCHLADDGRHYIACARRVAPPCLLSPRGSVPGLREAVEDVTLRLRIEVVRRMTPGPFLSSDAFVKGNRMHDPGPDEGVIQAASFLLQQGLPLLAKNLVLLAQKLPRYFVVCRLGRIKRLFHDHGVNLRFLGIVCQIVENIHAELPPASAAPVLALIRSLQLEMAARAAREALWDAWRRHVIMFDTERRRPGGVVIVGSQSVLTVNVSLEEYLADVTMTILTTISGDRLSFLSDTDKQYWEAELIPRIGQKFGYDGLQFSRRAGTASVASSSNQFVSSSPLPAITTHPTSAAAERALRVSSGVEARSSVPTTLRTARCEIVGITELRCTNWGVVSDPSLRSTPSAIVHRRGLPERMSSLASPSDTSEAMADDVQGLTSATSTLLEELGFQELLNEGESLDEEDTSTGPVLGAMQDPRLIARVCALAGVRLRLAPRASLDGIDCELTGHVKSVEAPALVKKGHIQSQNNLFDEVDVEHQNLIRQEKRRWVVLSSSGADMRCQELSFKHYKRCRLFGRVEQAIDILKRMRDVYQRDTGANECGTAVVSFHLSHLLQQLRRFHEAVDAATQCLQLVDAAMPHDRWVIAALMRMLDVLDVEGQPADAASIKHRRQLMQRLMSVSTLLRAPTSHIDARSALIDLESWRRQPSDDGDGVAKVVALENEEKDSVAASAKGEAAASSFEKLRCATLQIVSSEGLTDPDTIYYVVHCLVQGGATPDASSPAGAVAIAMHVAARAVVGFVSLVHRRFADCVEVLIRRCNELWSASNPPVGNVVLLDEYAENSMAAATKHQPVPLKPTWVQDLLSGLLKEYVRQIIFACPPLHCFAPWMWDKMLVSTAFEFLHIMSMTHLFPFARALYADAVEIARTLPYFVVLQLSNRKLSTHPQTACGHVVDSAVDVDDHVVTESNHSGLKTTTPFALHVALVAVEAGLQLSHCFDLESGLVKRGSGDDWPRQLIPSLITLLGTCRTLLNVYQQRRRNKMYRRPSVEAIGQESAAVATTPTSEVALAPPQPLSVEPLVKDVGWFAGPNWTQSSQYEAECLQALFTLRGIDLSAIRRRMTWLRQKVLVGVIEGAVVYEDAFPEHRTDVWTSTIICLRALLELESAVREERASAGDLLSIDDLEDHYAALLQLVTLGRDRLGAIHGQAKFEMLTKLAKADLESAKSSDAQRRAEVISQRAALLLEAAPKVRRRGSFRGAVVNPLSGGHTLPDNHHATPTPVPTLVAKSSPMPRLMAPAQAHANAAIAVSWCLGSTGIVPEKAAIGFVNYADVAGSDSKQVVFKLATRLRGGFHVRKVRGSLIDVIVPSEVGKYALCFFTHMFENATPELETTILILNAPGISAGSSHELARFVRRTPSPGPESSGWLPSLTPVASHWTPHSTATHAVRCRQGLIHRALATGATPLQTDSPPLLSANAQRALYECTIVKTASREMREVGRENVLLVKEVLLRRRD